jgi:hypothetical protein
MCRARARYAVPTALRRKSGNASRLELTYAKWALPLPLFVRPEHREWYVRKGETYAWRRGSYPQADDGMLTFGERRYTHGEVDVMHDVAIQESKGRDCGPDDKLAALLRPFSREGASKQVDRLFWAVIPATWTFQHWMENTLPKMAQVYVGWPPCSRRLVRLVTTAAAAGRAARVRLVQHDCRPGAAAGSLPDRGTHLRPPQHDRL